MFFAHEELLRRSLVRVFQGGTASHAASMSSLPPAERMSLPPAELEEPRWFSQELGGWTSTATISPSWEGAALVFAGMGRNALPPSMRLTCQRQFCCPLCRGTGVIVEAFIGWEGAASARRPAAPPPSPDASAGGSDTPVLPAPGSPARVSPVTPAAAESVSAASGTSVLAEPSSAAVVEAAGDQPDAAAGQAEAAGDETRPALLRPRLPAPPRLPPPFPRVPGTSLFMVPPRWARTSAAGAASSAGSASSVASRASDDARPKKRPRQAAATRAFPPSPPLAMLREEEAEEPEEPETEQEESVKFYEDAVGDSTQDC